MDRPRRWRCAAPCHPLGFRPPLPPSAPRSRRSPPPMPWSHDTGSRPLAVPPRASTGSMQAALAKQAATATGTVSPGGHRLQLPKPALGGVAVGQALPAHVNRVIDAQPAAQAAIAVQGLAAALQDRKSTRLNSSHVAISYAVFCLKKKNNTGG